MPVVLVFNVNDHNYQVHNYLIINDYEG